MKPEKQDSLLGHGRTMLVPKGSKRKRPRKPVGLQIPETKQLEIAMRRAAGESKTTIAKSLGMARKTVNRVLRQGEYQLLIQRCRSQLAELLPRAARVVERLLKQKRITNKQVDVAIAVLTGLQVLVPRSRTDVALAQPNEFEGWSKEQILEYIHKSKK